MKTIVVGALMSGAIVGSSNLQAGQAPQGNGTTASQQSLPYDIIFDVSRADYFFRLVEGRRCAAMQRKDFAALNQRYVRARSILAARSDVDVPEQAPPLDRAVIGQQTCSGGELLGFQDKIVRLEQHVANN